MERRHIITLCWLSFGIGMVIGHHVNETIGMVILAAVTALWIIRNP